MHDRVVSLRSHKALVQDVGMGVARIDYGTMDLLAASTGDVVEIRGKRRTATKCFPLYPSDEGKQIIRIDRLVRKNSGIDVGGTAQVRKVKAVTAEKIVIAPLGARRPIAGKYFAKALGGFPLTRDDYVMVPYLRDRLVFRVTGTVPVRMPVQVVTQKTEFCLVEEDTKMSPKA